MKQETKKICRMCLMALLLATVVYVILYFAFIVRLRLYIYKDIGSDTYRNYLPNIIFDLRSIASGFSGEYSLQRGLGEFYGGNLYKYLNPVNLPFLILGEEHLHLALMCSLYLKYALICIFAVLFFRRLLKDEKLAIVCALLWTFCSYAVLWGQHYQNLTNLTALTTSMYGLQLFLDKDRKRFLFIPALAWLAYSSYFCLYTSCFLFAGYSILYLRFKKKKWSEIWKKAGIFLAGGILAVCMAGESILPSLSGFWASTRLNDVVATERTVPFVYSIQYLLSFIARLLSNDTLGVGNSYSGPANYYEIAMLSVSILFIFMLVLLLQSKKRKWVFGIIVVCLAVLCMPIFSQIMSFSVEKQRWIYIYCFGEVILIGGGLKYFFKHYGESSFQKIVKRTVKIVAGIYIGCLVLLWIGQFIWDYQIEISAFVYVLVFLIIYSCFFLYIQKIHLRYRYFVLASIVLIELIVGNYASINERETMTPEEWENSMYYDGTNEVVQWIKSQDNSLFRINKSYASTLYNDSLFQGYNGVSVYNSTNSEELVELYTSFGYSLYRGESHWIRFWGEDGIANSLLGVKYIISHADAPLVNPYYEEIYRTSKFIVYENVTALGFGYLYYDEIGRSDFEKMDQTLREHVLTQYYFRTDEMAEKPCEIDFEEEDLERCYDLSQEIENTRNCIVQETEEGVEVKGIGEDAQLYVTMPEIPEGWMISELNITVETEGDEAFLQLFLPDENGNYFEENSQVKKFEDGEASIYMDIEDYLGSLEKFRLDPSNKENAEVVIKSMEIKLVNTERSMANLEELQQTCMKDLTQEGNTFTGTVNNVEDKQAMLCIPIVYNQRWRAQVDGKEIEIHNINGGLIGIELEPGEHTVKLVYENNVQNIGRMFGLTATIAYLVGAGIWWVKKGRKESC